MNSSFITLGPGLLGVNEMLKSPLNMSSYSADKEINMFYFSQRSDPNCLQRLSADYKIRGRQAKH